MDYFNLYKKRITSYKDFISIDRVKLSENIIINSIHNVAAQIVDDSDTKDQKLITIIDYVLKNGDIIDWQSEKWIILLTDNMADIYYRGTLRRCVGTLKWIDEYGDVNERYFTFKSDPATNFGTSDGKIITLGNERRSLLVSYDDDTKTLEKDKRFIFDSRAWKITAIDNISMKGISIITVEEDLIDTAKDNLELQIANYVAPNYEIFVDKTRLSLAAGESNSLNVVVKNNGVIIPSPTLTFLSSEESICVVSDTGIVTSVTDGEAAISITYKDVSINIPVAVNSVPAHNYTVEILDSAISNKFVITKSRSKTFTCEFKDNDTYMFETGIFSITDLNGNPTSLAVILSQFNNSVVVRGDGIGFVLLNVRNNEGTISNSKQIQIKSVI